LRKDDKVKSQEKAGKIFDLFDTNADGELTVPELRALIEVISADDSQRLLDISAFKNGITRKEFIATEICQIGSNKFFWCAFV
jgi:Ca2+-binding EF-hand superfamily protein